MLVRFGAGVDAPEASLYPGPWKQYDDILGYAYDELIHAHEDDEFIILVDSSLDQGSPEMVEGEFRKLIDQIRSDSRNYGLFQDAYFVVVLDKKTREVTLLRDPSGIKGGYYCVDGSVLWVGNLVHGVARAARVTDFNKEAVFQLLYTFSLSDGFTLYDTVSALKIGQRLTISRDLQFLEDRSFSIDLADEENSLTLEQNACGLRQGITEAIKRQSSNDNVVLLSGGIDSVVMLATLDELRGKSRVRAASYRVKGTDQDETGYATEYAEHLDVPFRVVEADPYDEAISRDFEETILKMNNPYYGVWIFGKFDAPSVTNKYFAGQDTRLHTPDMSVFHKAAFTIHLLRRNWIIDICFSVFHWLTRPIRALDLNCSTRRWLKGIGRLFELFDLAEFIQRFVFHVDSRAFARAGLPLDYFERIRRSLRVDLEGVTSARQIYNRITKVRWRNQFINDIRYLDDLARINKTYLAVPFYDPQLAIATSALPMRHATKTVLGRDKYSPRRVLINKYLLRLAFKDKLTASTYHRQKAVSMTLHLLFEGSMGTRVREILSDDLHLADSFLRKFNLENFLARFQRENSWRVSDFQYLLGVYYLATLCVYNRTVLTRSDSTTQESSRTVRHTG